MLRNLAPLAALIGALVLGAGGSTHGDSRPSKPPKGRWIAGDLHVHTIYSHDVCNPANPSSEQCGEEPWTTGFTPAQQLALAEARGLGFLALTDHNTLDHLSDPGWNEYSGPLILIPGQELSLKGHANVLGYAGDVQNRRGAATPEEVQAIIDEVHAGGGLFGVNHPQDPLWAYGRRPGPAEVTGFDSIEIWNISWQYQKRFFPFLAASDNPQALKYWESWLDRGVRVPGVGGSDSHWVATHAIQGVGQPSTWVFVERDGEKTSLADILEGIRLGRVFVASEPPAFGGARLHFEADSDGRGGFDTIAGGSVSGDGPHRLRVRVVNGAGNTLRLVVNGGKVIATREVARPEEDFVLRLTLPNGTTWIRADLYAGEPDTAMTAISSPIYVDPA